MATERFPNRNVNVPLPAGAVQAARERAAPGRSVAPYLGDPNNAGSRREVRPGEWIDDRRIELDRPASPSADSPPELEKSTRSVPASYDPTKVYAVALGKGVEFSGRMLSPGKSYQMVGDACTEISAAIIGAEEVGAIPVDPNVAPSSAKKKA